jgi:hypothetical protein
MRMTPEEERTAYRLELAYDYGQFVCGPTPIDINGARAFNPGMPVPASHIKKFPELEALVVKVDNPEPKPTKAAVAAEVSITKKDGA